MLLEIVDSSPSPENALLLEAGFAQFLRRIVTLGDLTGLDPGRNTGCIDQSVGYFPSADRRRRRATLGGFAGTRTPRTPSRW